MTRYLVTGGAGFIGSALCHRLLAGEGNEVVIIDKMTYAANPQTVAELARKPGFRHIKADICDAPAMEAVVAEVAPDVIFHMAAETHVDRAIDGAGVFIETNLIGTYSMLQAARRHHDSLAGGKAESFRFVHVSTDEVFGALGDEGRFDEQTAYDPSSPYSASKAGSDHLVRAWHRTYGLPVLISNCSNNYGPRQFPEKLIPLMILKCLAGEPLPVYGDGSNVRDWLHVEDHARALQMIADRGAPGRTFCVGGNSERTNLQIVEELCRIMDRRRPAGAPHSGLIEFVADRPGHDYRYAIDSRRLQDELGWAPLRDFESGLAETVDWYLSNPGWWQPLREAVYAGERLGTV